MCLVRPRATSPKLIIEMTSFYLGKKQYPLDLFKEIREIPELTIFNKKY